MNIEKYAINALSKTEYQFFSEGKNGRFEMRICFESITPDFYNLAFGLWDAYSMKIEDGIELRNGDMDKILGTVANAAISFLQSNPQVSIAASGRTLPGEQAIRTRKYQMGINKYFITLSPNYNIYGFKAARNEDNDILGTWPYEWEGEWEVFSSGSNYDAFLINLKK